MKTKKVIQPNASAGLENVSKVAWNSGHCFGTTKRVNNLIRKALPNSWMHVMNVFFSQCPYAYIPAACRP